MNDKIVKAFLETDMGSFRYQAIEGEAPIHKEMVKKMPKSAKKYVATLSWNKMKIFIVDGKWVRDNIDVAFTGGTHPYEADWMPREIWIEDTKNPADLIYFLCHEIIELIQMSLGKKSYQKSHDLSNSCEDAIRAMGKIANGK